MNREIPSLAASYLEFELMNSISHLPEARAAAGKIGPNRGYGRPKRTRDRAGKQEALIQAALGLFATKGYDATTTREIAAAAGCAEGLIHRYFKGKAGLLPALVKHHFSKEMADLTRQLQPAPNLEAEFVQLVLWAVERFWETQDFLKVFIPRAFVDPALAGVLKRAVVSIRARKILERLKRYECCLKLSQEELEMLANSVGMLGLVFGFMRPLVLGQDRVQAKRMATTVGKMLVRGLDSTTSAHQFS
jgi:AcrR family transcriptional regulator